MNQNHAWKEKVQEIFQTCTDEIKKTTEIGMKMLSASKTNSQLHESYDELGRLVYKAMKNQEFEWDNPRAKELMALIISCKKDLKDLEEEVVKIKEASPPQDESKRE